MRRSWLSAGLAIAALTLLAGAWIVACDSVIGIMPLSGVDHDAALDGAVESGADAATEGEADASDAGALACPAAPPDAGTCVGAGECLYGCTALKGDFVYATCSGGAWKTTKLACGTVNCGATVCETPANVCVETLKVAVCAPNPCRGKAMTVDCTCAASLCTGTSPVCVDADTAGFSVACAAK